MEFAVKQCKPGALIGEVCDRVDAEMARLARNVPNAGNPRQPHLALLLDVGIAFPCCVSPSSILCHFAPLPEEEPEYKTPIQSGDLIKMYP